MGTIVAGVVVGVLRGWAISLCILAIMPLIGISSAAYFRSIAAGSANGLMAYSQSAGYAEQAMSAIRVVVAFG
jgi:ABC-type multidrug transport system fused ATPase/permease subunit